MVALYCAVVGVAGSAFPADIDERLSVGHLKKAIKDQKKNDLKDVDADKLQLFLAKKGDAWLKDDDPAALELEEGKTYQDIQTVIDGEKMKATWTIEEVLTANNMTKRKGRAPKSKQIHVLVVLPKGAVGSVSEASVTTQMAREIHDLHDQAMQKKRKRYVHSQLNSTQGRELLANLNIQVDVVRTVPYAARKETQIDAFKWGSVSDECGKEIALTEEQQRERYRAYVEANVSDELIANQLCVIGVEKGENILTVQVGGRDIELKGRTDLLILSDVVKDNPSDARYFPEVKLLIEVKRAVIPSFDFQAMSELIALDLIVNYPVMALLTDLNGVWLFFWVSEKENDSARICKARIRTPGEAFEVIKTLLTQSPTADAEIRLPCFQESVKRQKLSKVLPPIGEGGESGGIRESIERYYDIASMLGPDLDMARAVARQVTRSIPTLSYFS